MFIDIRERGWGDRKREREKDIDVREKHQLAVFRTRPDQELNPQPFSVWDSTPTN